MRASIRSGDSSWPNPAPAARVMLSFINVPPRSFTPAFRHACTPRGPIFTHEAWMFGTSGCSARRATACISSDSRNVGPRRALPLR